MDNMNGFYYIASVIDKDGCTYNNVEVLNFDETFIGKDIWAKVTYANSITLKINDAKISDEDLYHLGFVKVISIKKVEVVETEKTIYER